MQCIRVLMALSLAMGLPGCRDEVESSTYPIGQTGETCTAYKGFERQPPEVVVAELAKRGLDSSRLVHRTVCGPITSWDILPAGASIDRIPPPDAYVSVHLQRRRLGFRQYRPPLTLAPPLMTERRGNRQKYGWARRRGEWHPGGLEG